MQDPHRFNMRGWLLWLAGFLSFPIAGLAAEAVVGRVDDAGSALVGGSLGAITLMALSGVLLDRLHAATPASQPAPPTAIA
jgi:hypothetical protein